MTNGNGNDHPPFSFDELLTNLSQLGGAITTVDSDTQEMLRAAADGVRSLDELTAGTLADLLRNNPDWALPYAFTVGLSQEQLKNQLKLHCGTSGWIRLGRNDPHAIVDMLDREFGLVEEVRNQRNETWSYGDVLVERASARARASSGQERGRNLEDEVEAVVGTLGLTYSLRTQFVGSRNRVGPVDIAIPAGGAQAQILVGVKGFDSTGSKLTSAADEATIVADIRRPTQFVFWVMDGIGWLNRTSDLRTVYDLWAERRIDGLYTIATLGEFGDAVERAAQRLGLL